MQLSIDRPKEPTALNIQKRQILRPWRERMMTF